MIRIALVSHLDEISGAGVALVELACGLDRTRFAPVLILPGNGPLAERAAGRGLEVVVVPNPQVSLAKASAIQRVGLGFRRIFYIFGLMRAFARYKIDLIYINTTATVFPEIAGRLSRRKMVCHVHETFSPAAPLSARKGSIIRKSCSGMLYASESARKGFPPGPGVPSIIVKNYVDVDALGKRGRVPRGDEDFLVVANGMFPRKGNDVLLQAAALANRSLHGRKIRLKIIGNPQEEHADFSARMQTLAQVPELAGKVEFTASASPLVEEMILADAFVSASRNEALPISLVEAMAIGVPVIATDVSDCARVLGGGQYGWVTPPENAGALAQALVELALNPRLAAQRTGAARGMVLREYAGVGFWDSLELWLEGLR